MSVECLPNPGLTFTKYTRNHVWFIMSMRGTILFSIIKTNSWGKLIYVINYMVNYKNKFSNLKLVYKLNKYGKKLTCIESLHIWASRGRADRTSRWQCRRCRSAAARLLSHPYQRVAISFSGLKIVFFISRCHAHFPNLPDFLPSLSCFRAFLSIFLAHFHHKNHVPNMVRYV